VIAARHAEWGITGVPQCRPSDEIELCNFIANEIRDGRKLEGTTSAGIAMVFPTVLGKRRDA
jgi:hypothetical protein